MNKINISRDSKCHIWDKSQPLTDDLLDALEVIKSYGEEDSHLIRKLKKCKTCGQLFFYEFYEKIDWVGGNDPQYRTWIPVADQATADSLSKLAPIEILQFPRIIKDWPSEATQPSPAQRIC